VRAGDEADVPAVLRVELLQQRQQFLGGGVEAGGQVGDGLAKGMRISDAAARSDEDRRHDGGDDGICGRHAASYRGDFCRFRMAHAR
jgi:hypothetical protein